ncbi:MAG: hypothetical protein JJE10_07805 [Thermoleophilia bacterium]|nr:hypothetical protein [Thermoleophilia bacterium]
MACLFLLAVPVPHGQAHRASHPFESVLDGISPEVLGEGIEAEMLDFDSQIRLKNGSGKSIVVRGYDGEPYARLDPGGGVFLNSRSPAYFLNSDRYARTPVDPAADPSARPQWVRVADDGELVWFDHRSHYMKSGTPPGLEDPGRREKLFDYRIPLTVGGSEAALNGTLYWAAGSRFPMGIVAGLLVATSLCAGFGYFAIRAIRRGGKEPPAGSTRP